MAGSYVAMLALWHGRDLLAIVVILIIAHFGLGAIMAILPFTDAYRARMAAEDELNERYPSCKYKRFLWPGLCMLTVAFWRGYPGPIAVEDFIAAAFFLVSGFIATLIWHFRHRGVAGGA